MKTTMDNLKEAFAGESQANRKYLAYSKKAATEGYPQVAKLFKAAAEAETIHALAHFQAMGGVKSTLENLKDAVAGETYEYKEMYPPMLEQATSDSHRAKTMFGFALKAEEVHAKLYAKALAALERLPTGYRIAAVPPDDTEEPLECRLARIPHHLHSTEMREFLVSVDPAESGCRTYPTRTCGT